jgi:hypothetical protein
MHPNYKGPYRIAVLMTGADGTPAPARHTDGAMIILGLDDEGESAPVLTIPMRARAKRGEAWRTTDPDQESFARALVAALNAYSDLETIPTPPKGS